MSTSSSTTSTTTTTSSSTSISSNTQTSPPPTHPTSPPSSTDPSTIATYSNWSDHTARTKKSDTLVPFPIFTAHWLPATLQSAAVTAAQPFKTVGTVLFGGGGGRPGTGVASGLVLCTALRTNQPATPIELSPIGFLSTHDTILMHILPHPLYPELALALGTGTAVTHINHTTHTLHPLSHTATDFAPREPSAQAQAFSPAGELLATGGEDRTVRLWRYRDMRLVGVCGAGDGGGDGERHKDMVLSLDFNSDGTLLASCGGDGRVLVWDTAALMRRIAKEDEAGDGKGRDVEQVVVPLLTSVTVPAAAGQTVKFQVCKFIGGSRVPLVKVEHAEDAAADSAREEKTNGLRQRGAAAAAQQRQRAAAAPSTASVPSPSSSTPNIPEQLLAVCNLASRTNPSNRLIAVAVPSRPLPPPSTTTSSPASSAAPNPPLTTATLTRPTTPLTFPLLRSTVCSKHQLTQMAVSPNGRYLALADNDGSVLLFDALSFRPLYRSVQCHGLPATALCFSSDSGLLLSASADKTFRFFDMAVVAGRRGAGWWSVVWWVVMLMLLGLLGVVLAVGVGMLSGSDGSVFGLRWRDVEDVLDVVGLWLTGTRSQARMNARRVG